jgi:hypothetical protein
MGWNELWAGVMVQCGEHHNGDVSDSDLTPPAPPHPPRASLSRPNVLRVAGSFPSLPIPSRSRRALVATAAASPAAAREWDEYIAPAPAPAAVSSGGYDESLLVATAAAAAAGWDMWLAWQVRPREWGVGWAWRDMREGGSMLVTTGSVHTCTHTHKRTSSH